MTKKTEAPIRKTEAIPEEGPEVISGELCPFCQEKTLTLLEHEMEVPFFGPCYIFSMDCSSCKYHKADVESDEERDPSRYTLEITSEEDLKIRVVKSSFATIKLPHITTIESGGASNGYVTNVEGILNRIKKQIEVVRDDPENDDEDRKKAKNLLKKLIRIMWGQEKAKLIIEDPTGNSAIISEKAVKEKMKK
jgi:zinc finger protein